jgi:hypothetical protein
LVSVFCSNDLDSWRRWYGIFGSTPLHQPEEEVMGRSMFEEKWYPVVDFPHFVVSNQGRVQTVFSRYMLRPFVQNGDIYVELTNANGQYVEVSLAVILITSVPEEK